MKLVENRNIKTERGTKVFSHESYAQEMYDFLMRNEEKMPVFTKDLKNGDLLLITGINGVHGNEVDFEVNNANSVSIDLEKEKRFLSNFGVNIEEFKMWILGNPSDFLNHENYISIAVDSNGIKASLSKGMTEKLKIDFFKQITNPTHAYTAKVISKNRGGFLVNIMGVDAFLPGSLAAANKIIDFDQFIGSDVNVMIEDFLKDIGTFIVSNKKYIKHILPIKIKELDREKKHTGVITDTAKFGIFIEIDNFFTGLLHTSKMNQETLDLFYDGKYRADDSIDVYIKEITKDNRLVFSSYNKEQQLEIEKEEKKEKEKIRHEIEVKTFKVGEEYSGLITVIKNFGAFARIWHGNKTVTGLILKKNLSSSIKEGDKPKIRIISAEDGKYFLETVE